MSRSFRVSEAFDERLEISRLSEVVGRADAVVVALPLTKQTKGILDYDLLSRTKEVVTIVNVGRGELVPEEGLKRWLREKTESRYATDVFWDKNGREAFDTDAWGLSNFAGTRHVSGVPLGETLEGPMTAAARNVDLFIRGGSASNKVDLAEYL
ncbi:MAG: hypothetical protein HY297_03345 [Thaumarchaeota archaeon]|nr:hypothetical protein [Nitrososphaerota archaeon]